MLLDLVYYFLENYFRQWYRLVAFFVLFCDVIVWFCYQSNGEWFLLVLIFFLNNTCYTIYLDHILSFSPRYLSYSPTFIFFIPLSKREKKSYRKQTKTQQQQKRKKTQKHGICFVLGNYYWKWGLVWSVVVITEAKTFNETGFLSPSRYRL